MAAMVAAGAVTQPFSLNVPPKGTTIGPALPLLPLWMCAAVGFVNPLSLLKLQQTFRVLPRSLTLTWALPVGAPLDTSFLPASCTLTIVFLAFVAAAPAAAVAQPTPAAASRETAATLVRMIENLRFAMPARGD